MPPAHNDPDDQFDRMLGERIRRLRAERGMTQPDLAEQLSISYQQVQKYENGDSAVATKRLVQIARALGVPLGELLPDPESVAEGDPSRYRLTPEELRFVRLFRRIRSKKERRVVISQLEIFAERDRT